MSNSRLLKQGEVVSMQDTFTTVKTKLGHTTLNRAAGWT